MAALVVFIITSMVSFMGSVQLGPVNSAVISHSLSGRDTSAAWISFGGVLPEILYSGTALYVLLQALDVTEVKPWLRLISTTVIMGYGLYLIWSRPSRQISTRQKTHLEGRQGLTHGFSTGFLLALFNPLLLPFWLMVLFKMNQYSILAMHQRSSQAAFVFGSAAGAFALLMFFRYMARRNSEWIIRRFRNRVDIALGLILIFLGIANYLIKS